MFFRKKRFAAIMALLMVGSLIDVNIVQATEVNANSLNVSCLDESDLKAGGISEVTAEEISESEMEDIPEYNLKLDTDETDGEDYEESENVFNYGSQKGIKYCSTRGRCSLEKLTNGYNMQKAYDEIEEYFHKVQNGETINPTRKDDKNLLASIPLNSYKLSKDQLKIVFLCIRYDHPELFWLGTKYVLSVSKQSKLVTKASFSVLDNCVTTDYIKREKKEIEQAISEYLKAVEECKSDYEIEKVFHDKIIKETIYDPNYNTNKEVSINSYNIAGVFLDHVAVCEGYAKTLQILLNAKNIDNVFVVGGSANGPHAWNQVKINGEYYNCDPTWDDKDIPGDFGVRYDYFNVKDSEFTITHYPNNPDSLQNNKDYLYELEKCDSDEWTWTNIHKDQILSSEDCSEEAILEYIVSQLNNASEENLSGINMYGEDYNTTKKILNYIKFNKDKIFNNKNLTKAFGEKYEPNLICSALVDGDNDFKVTFRKKSYIETEDISISDELNIYFSNNFKYLNPVISPGFANDQIKWSINRSKIAKIDSKTGLISPLSPGRAIIMVQMGNAMDACLLTVYDSEYYTFKDDLQKLYDENKNKNEEDYLPENWSVFEEALTNAEDVLDDNKAVKSDIDSAIASLKDAVNNLI